jgi:hypothetical protein
MTIQKSLVFLLTAIGAVALLASRRVEAGGGPGAPEPASSAELAAARPDSSRPRPMPAAPQAGAPSRAAAFPVAHLDAVLTRRGQRVRAGTPIGRVGNTGNASRTPPHLHYAVHEGRDVLDPIPLLPPGGTRSAALRSGGQGVKAARTKLPGAALKSATEAGRTLAVLPRHEPVEVLAEEGRHFRVRYRGIEGYIARWLLEEA